MKSTQAVIIILGVFALGFIGYSFYTGMGKIDGNQAEYQFTEAEDLPYEDGEESNIDAQNEETLTSEIEIEENQEMQADAEFAELESMNF